MASCNTGQPVVITASRLNSFRRRIAELADQHTDLGEVEAEAFHDSAHVGMACIQISCV